MDRDREPLITRQHENTEDNPDFPSAQQSEHSPDSSDEPSAKSNGRFLLLLTLAAGISGLLFGYDTGIISATLVSVSTSLSGRRLTTLDKSLITSSTSLFALIASPITGSLADTLGRRTVILLASLLFTIGALVQAFSHQVWVMIIGRSIVGLAVGSASFVVPLYIAELSPAHSRGKMVTINCLFITGGQVIAYIVGWAFSEIDGGWRWMVGLGCLPAILQMGLLVGMPETPRWLTKVGRAPEATQVLTAIYGKGAFDEVKQVLHQIQQEVDAEDSLKPGTNGLANAQQQVNKLFTIGLNRRALAIACLLQASQQLCGFNSLMYFSATIFSLVGFRSPTLTSLSVAVTNLVFTLVAFAIIDNIGRRRILLTSIPLMALGMAFAGLCFNFLSIDLSSSAASAASSTDSTDPQSVWSYLLIASTMLYVAFYALSLGNVPWHQSELFPLSIRSLGSGISTATNWASNFLVGLTFLPMMEVLTPSGAFGVFAVVCILSWAAIWAVYPETAGLELEEVGGLMRDGFGVRQSVQRWKASRSRYAS